MGGGGPGAFSRRENFEIYNVFHAFFCPESMSVSSYQESYKYECGLLTASI